MFFHNHYKEKRKESVIDTISKLTLLSISGGVIIGLITGLFLKILKWACNQPAIGQF
ncbi:MAG TPA: hypothetical protein PL110_14470 [Candidatus Eremiobacteraeota bacterium]|nr:MAG: hypothetical protein BWY64_00006 [bacterium ADurb.Bin363]HPZ09310.1 hypothetical protein [Candidatus Eremiobacteraeota bacterium]